MCVVGCCHLQTDLSTDIEGFSSSSEGVDMADFDDKVLHCSCDNSLLSVTECGLMLFICFAQSLGAELTEKDIKFLYLVEMGFAEDEVSSCIDICG
jgi:hypothetical protein